MTVVMKGGFSTRKPEDQKKFAELIFGTAPKEEAPLEGIDELFPKKIKKEVV